MSELFPTEVRAAVASFVGAVNVPAGSLGLALVGIVAGAVDPSTSNIAMALACTAAVVVLRGVPETAGVEVIGAPTPPQERT